jgi:hypothetical protein
MAVSYLLYEVRMAEPKVKEKPSDVLRKQKLDQIAEIESEFGIEVDLSNVTLGDFQDLADSNIPVSQRFSVIEKFVSKGKARDIPILKLDRFMDLVTLKLEVQSNPTSGANGEKS